MENQQNREQLSATVHSLFPSLRSIFNYQTNVIVTITNRMNRTKIAAALVLPAV